MSNLLNTAEGRNALLIAQQYLLRRRLSRFFKRNNEIDVQAWREGGEYDLSNMLQRLNVAHDTEILDLYRLLGAVGGLSASISDVTYYVNPQTGSDVTGTGSAARPYASLWFFDNLPRRINHRYRILIGTPTVGIGIDHSDWDMVLNFTFGGPNGSLTIMGVGAPNIIADNYEVDNIWTLGGGGGLAIQATMPFGPFTEGWFLKGKTGSATGITTPIHACVSDTVITSRIPWVTHGLAAGDLLSVVCPLHVLTVHSLHGEGIGPIAHWNYDNLGAPLSIVNLNIAFSNDGPGNVMREKFTWKNNCKSLISFVRTTTDAMGEHAIFSNGDLNTINSDDDQISVLAASGVININNGLSGLTPEACGLCLAGPSTSENIIVENCTVQGIDTHSAVVSRGRAEIMYSLLGRLVSNQSQFHIYSCVLDGHVGGPLEDWGGIELYDSIGLAEYCTVLVSDNCFSLFGNCHVRIVMCGSDAVMSAISLAGIWAAGVNVGIDAVYNDPAVTPVTEGMIGATSNLMGWTKTGVLDPVAWGVLDAYTLFGNSDVTITR